MSYESATYVNQLDKNLPRGSDSVSEGDIHLRTIKEVLKNSFPNVDSEVNAIHSGPTAPDLHSAGTVWFDTSSGLVKMRDKTDSEWLNMAHGEAGGLGSILKMDLHDSPGVSKRNNSMELVYSITITPLSPTSTFIISSSGFASAWGYNSSQTVFTQFRDDTSDVNISGEKPVVGYQHVDDGGNFEIKCGYSTKDRYPNHPAGPFELGLYARCVDGSPGDGGYGLQGITTELLEVE